MTNFEKYHEEMIEKKYRAVKNGKPISCKSVGCSESELYDEGSTCTYSLNEGQGCSTARKKVVNIVRIWETDLGR